MTFREKHAKYINMDCNSWCAKKGYFMEKKIITLAKHLFPISLCLLLTYFFYKFHNNNDGIFPMKTTINPPPSITIWIHGSRVVPLPIVNRISSLQNFFHCKEGLNPVCSLDEIYHHRTVANTLIAASPDMFSLEHFYIFGWSGI